MKLYEVSEWRDFHDFEFFTRVFRVIECDILLLKFMPLRALHTCKMCVIIIFVLELNCVFFFVIVWDYLSGNFTLNKLMC